MKKTIPLLTEVFLVKEATPFSSSTGEKKGWLYKVTAKDVYHGGPKPIVSWRIYKAKQDPEAIKRLGASVHVTDVEEVGEVGPENWEGSLSKGNIEKFLAGSLHGDGHGNAEFYTLSGSNGPRKMPGSSAPAPAQASQGTAEKNPDSLDFD